MLKNMEMDIDEEIEIRSYYEPEALLQNIEEIDILFLDVELPIIDGFQVAEEILKRELRVKIIFLTAHKEYVQKAFKVKAFRYLYKPFDEITILEVMKDAIQEMEKEVVVEVGTEYESAYIRIKDICYIEAPGDGVAIYTDKGMIMNRKSLQYWAERLKRSCFRCHRAYLVNFQYLAEIEHEKAILKNGVEVPIAVRRKREIKKQYQMYIMKNARIAQ